MKKIPSLHFGKLSMLSLLFLLLSFSVAAQEMTDKERLERCENNKNRLAKLETDLKDLNEELKSAWTKKEIEDARDKMVFIRKIRTSEAGTDYHAKRNKIAGEYNFDIDNCFNPNTVDIDKAHKACLTKLEQVIAKKIDKAESLNRPELLNKKTDIEKQIASHKTNIIALRCTEKVVSKDEHPDYIKLSGTWNSIQLGPIRGPLQLNVSRTGVVSGHSTGKSPITITGGDYSPKYKTLRFNYVMEDSKKAGKATLTFIEGSTTYELNGTSRYADGSYSNPWVLEKEK